MQKKQTNLADWSQLLPISLGPGPRSQALYREIRHLIEQGQLPPLSKLPATRELSKRLKLSRTAIIGCYERLQAEGFVETKIGAGSFIAAAVPLIKQPDPQISGDEWEESQRIFALSLSFFDDVAMNTFRRRLNHHLSRPEKILFSYGDPRGPLRLRCALSHYLTQTRGLRCKPEQILISCGVRHGLDLFARSQLRAHDPGLV